MLDSYFYTQKCNNKKNILPVCFAFDEGYIMPTSVAINSLLEHLNVKYVVHIFLLVPDTFDFSKAKIINLFTSYANVYKIEYIKITDKRFSDKCTIKHITYPTFYRLVMASYIPYSKCIYLDGDIIVMDDISTMMDIDISEYYIAGVTTPYSQLRKRDKKEAMIRLNIETYSLYVNAGVLIFNLDKIRKYDMETKFMSLLDKRFPVQDQDILNASCYPNILKIPCKFNCVEDIMRYPISVLRKIYTMQTIEDARKKPVVFHFADKYKPWKYTGMSYEDKWDASYQKLYNSSILNKKKYMFTRCKEWLLMRIYFLLHGCLF